MRLKPDESRLLEALRVSVGTQKISVQVCIFGDYVIFSREKVGRKII